MIELGFIWAEHIVDARKHQSANPDKPFDPPQRTQGKRLGECLVELGYIDEENIRTALTIQETGNAIRSAVADSGYTISSDMS